MKLTEPRDQHVATTITATQLVRLDTAAADNRRTRSDMIRFAIEEYIEALAVDVTEAAA